MGYKASFLSTLCCALLILSVQKWGVNSALSSNHIEDSSSLIDPQPLPLKNLPTLGLRNLFANYEFIRFLLYFGNEDIRHTGYSSSPELLESVIHKEPYFMDFYLFLSQSTTIYAGRPDKTIQIMNEGISRIDNQYPDDGYRVWRYKGIDELLFLNNIQEAQASYEKAGILGSQSSEPSIQAVGRRSLQTASFLSKNPDSRQARISAWSNLMTTTFSDEARQRAAYEIQKLGGEVTFGEGGSISVQYNPAEQSPSQDDSNT